MSHRWTTHGHACCPDAPLAESTRPQVVARCGGPAICTACAVEAGAAHSQGATPDRPVDAFIALDPVLMSEMDAEPGGRTLISVKTRALHDLMLAYQIRGMADGKLGSAHPTGGDDA
jgi:hypothetical protein